MKIEVTHEERQLIVMWLDTIATIADNPELKKEAQDLYNKLQTLWK